MSVYVTHIFWVRVRERVRVRVRLRVMVRERVRAREKSPVEQSQTVFNSTPIGL